MKNGGAGAWGVWWCGLFIYDDINSVTYIDYTGHVKIKNEYLFVNDLLHPLALRLHNWVPFEAICHANRVFCVLFFALCLEQKNIVVEMRSESRVRPFNETPRISPVADGNHTSKWKTLMEKHMEIIENF